MQLTVPSNVLEKTVNEVHGCVRKNRRIPRVQENLEDFKKRIHMVGRADATQCSEKRPPSGPDFDLASLDELADTIDNLFETSGWFWMQVGTTG